MYREISRSEALQAVLDNKKVFTISISDHYLWLDDFSKVLDGRRYMVDDDVPEHRNAYIDVINKYTAPDVESDPDVEPDVEKSRAEQVGESGYTNHLEETLTENTSEKQVESVGGGTPEKQVKPKTCAYCGKKFMDQARKKYCSDECAREAHNAQMKQYKIDQGIAVGAGKNPPHKVTKKCTICGREFEGPPASKKCPDCKAKAKQTAVADFPIKACKHRDCAYRTGQGGDETCDYMLMTGLPRECDFETCDKYKPRAGNEHKHI